jgi:hypothetical protein
MAEKYVDIHEGKIYLVMDETVQTETRVLDAGSKKLITIIVDVEEKK